MVLWQFQNHDFIFNENLVDFMKEKLLKYQEYSSLDDYEKFQNQGPDCSLSWIWSNEFYSFTVWKSLWNLCSSIKMQFPLDIYSWIKQHALCFQNTST